MTDKKRVRTITSLTEFMEWVKQLPEGQYLYRGVSKASYEIEASACRRLPDEDRKKRSELLKVTEELIEKARLAGHDERNGRRLTSDLELLAELQHYGAATCLIDFTQDALTALWVACQKSSGKGEQEDGKVFAVRHDDLSKFETVKYDDLGKNIGDFFNQRGEGEEAKMMRQSENRLYQWQPKHQNNRIVAQRSVFVFGDTQIEAESECEIKENCKEGILRELENISRITEANMFPDFEGFARQHAHDKLIIKANLEDYMRRAQESYQRREYEEAVKNYDKAIELNPKDATIYRRRGFARLNLDRYEEAMKDFNKAIHLNPMDAVTYRGRGFAETNLKRYKEAIENFDKAINLNPMDKFAYRGRGLAELYLGRYKKAIKDLDKAISLNPTDKFAYRGRGSVNLYLKRYYEAMEDFNKAIELSPRYADAYYDRGLTKLYLERYYEAMEDFDKVMDLNGSRSTTAFYSRSICWLCLREWDKARGDLIAARERGYDIVSAFHYFEKGIPTFEKKHNIQLPDDIKALLTLDKDKP